MNIEEKKLLACLIFEEQVDDKDIQRWNIGWKNRNSFIKWAVKKIRTESDKLVMKDENAPPYYFNLKFVSSESVSSEAVVDRSIVIPEKFAIPKEEPKKKRGRPRLDEVR